MSIFDNDNDINMRAQTLVDAYYERLYQLAYRLCSDMEMSKDLAFCTLEKALETKTGSFSDERAFDWVVNYWYYRNLKIVQNFGEIEEK